MSQSQATSQRPLRILSFDGGGVRGVSSLLILKEIMFRLNLKRKDQTLRDLEPWEAFDMICGTSTGGLIAIMLGRLHMPVEKAIEAYAALAKYVFGSTNWFWQEGSFDAGKLEKAIKLLVGMYAVPEPHAELKQLLKSEREDISQRHIDIGNNVRMMRSGQDDPPQCRVFVCAMMASNMAHPTRFRTYQVDANPTPNCYIWQAARATSAAPTFFKPASIEEHGISMTFLDGGLRCNNPIRELLDEASSYKPFKGRPVSCILSIGTGKRGTASLSGAGIIPKLQLLGVINMLKKIALDCEKVEQDVASQLKATPNTYFRFNVDHGLQKIGLQEWDAMDDLVQHTNAYKEGHDVSSAIDRAVSSLMRTEWSDMITIERAAGLCGTR
ncbi:patatin-like phospholipase protein [Ceratobasidium sp. AG-Ba]|nr:patatin-like phospholipase protein [Ceratobasidium sp. AG-Ba]